MFRSFPFGLIFSLLFYLQVELIEGSPPPHQNVLPPNVSVLSSDPAASASQNPFRHQNTLLQNEPRAIRGPQDMPEGTETRIVGGAPATPHEFPHHVYLSRNNHFFCGGSIISQRLILTAAHCVHGGVASSIKVTAGAHDRYRPSGLEQVRAVDEIIVHPSYTRADRGDDIAILVLSNSLHFSPAVGSIGLPDRDVIFSVDTTVVGWGLTESGGSTSGVLRKVTVPIVPNPQCNSQYKPTAITEQMFCAGEAGQDSCQGDSGGPALCITGWGLWRSPVLCGIVSFGRGCGLPDYPGVYVQVSKYISWIVGILTNRTLVKHCNGANVSSVAKLTSCVTQYLPETDTRRRTPCDAKQVREHGFLLTVNDTSLLRIDLHQLELIEALPLELIRNPKSFDFDLKNNVIYWADTTQSAIKRLNFDGMSRPEELVKFAGVHIKGLAFDWMSSNLYFTDYVGSTIEVIRTDGVGSAVRGRMRKVLLTKPDVHRPTGIVVHPGKGYIFWIDVLSSNPSIGRAHLDGSNATKIISKANSGKDIPVSYPSGITLDTGENRIYWVDEFSAVMISADFNGSDVKIVLKGDPRISNPVAVGFYKNTVYWGGYYTDGLYKAPLQNDKTVSNSSISSIIDLPRPRDLKIYGGGMQVGENLCSISNCSYLCMVSPDRTVSCLCPDGFTKQNDTCA